MSIDNSHILEKVELREKLINKYFPNGNISVIDCCAGHKYIWNFLKKTIRCKKYLPIDIDEKKGVLRIDAVRVLKSGITADIIDIDAYFSPYEMFFYAVKNIKSMSIIFLTIGIRSMRNMREASKIVVSEVYPKFKKLKMPKVLIKKYTPYFESIFVYKCIHDNKLKTIEAGEISHQSVKYQYIVLEKIKDGSG